MASRCQLRRRDGSNLREGTRGVAHSLACMQASLACMQAHSLAEGINACRRRIARTQTSGVSNACRRWADDRVLHGVLHGVLAAQHA